MWQLWGTQREEDALSSQEKTFSTAEFKHVIACHAIIISCLMKGKPWEQAREERWWTGSKGKTRRQTNASTSYQMRRKWTGSSPQLHSFRQNCRLQVTSSASKHVEDTVLYLKTIAAYIEKKESTTKEHKSSSKRLKHKSMQNDQETTQKH